MQNGILKDFEQNNEIDYKSVKLLGNFNITIDGKTETVTDDSKNIVEIAKSAGIAIPSPCFLAKTRKGCCMACVVEIDKNQSYVCGTKAKEGMNVIVNRDDLTAIRKERLLKYQVSIQKNKLLKCNIE